MVQIPGDNFQFSVDDLVSKIGNLQMLLEQEQRRRVILFQAYMELKNKYEPDVVQLEGEQIPIEGNPREEVSAS